MTVGKVLFSSEKTDWETPQDLFDKLDEEFNFELDVCATLENAKCAKFYSLVEEGLSNDWHGVCWMNPPYGKEIGRWIEKSYLESQKGATVVCLLPSRTDTRYFHDYCVHGEIRFIRGRLKFVGAKSSAPFPSMIVIFRPPATKTFTWKNPAVS
jgi:phage N-6-adenine-methyltransferase